MSLSLFIARRIYRESDGGKQVSRPAVLIAMAGIAIGLAVMIIAVAVVIGFKSEVRNKVIGFGSHIQIANLDAVNSYETHPIVVGDSMIAALSAYSEVDHVQRYSTKPGMIKTDDAFQGMVLKGVGPEFDPSFMQEYLIEGEIPVFSDSVSSNQVIISKALATKMKLKLGDRIYTYYIQDNIRARRLTIAGIYQTNFSEYDNLFLLTDLNLVNRLNGWKPEQVSGVELQVRDYDKLEDVTYQIAVDTDNQQDNLGGTYYVRNIEQLNPQIFEWLGLLDTNIWVILFLMMGVAGFTMISGLLIIIIERTNMIGILKALGADNFTIRKTFLWFSVFLIGKGMIWGNIFGLAFCFLQSYFKIFKLDPANYYMDSVPVSFNILFFLLINLGTLLASVLMLIGPSFLITKINPASSMRYE
ncbi:ABC transporter permease [uncultured Bacteroides sp.]|uniref:ABC transporter permease n=1 Tax=uncultured Bacteroides sp. TaxID=162156 RepID=UPI0025F35E94|nr:ABC transporter permease [uncultured Bacteroides sp.]